MIRKIIHIDEENATAAGCAHKPARWELLKEGKY